MQTPLKQIKCSTEDVTGWKLVGSELVHESLGSILVYSLKLNRSTVLQYYDLSVPHQLGGREWGDKEGMVVFLRR